MSRLQERLGHTATCVQYDCPRLLDQRCHAARCTFQYVNSLARAFARFNQVHQSTLFTDVPRLMQCHQKAIESMCSTLGAG